ncbi:MAG: sigma-70 family RNA polymerase sigma factor [Firmicutes bacterium]|nr:sigma-70 family RNA polymerase sigma factor [Bacillota bacterium]
MPVVDDLEAWYRAEAPAVRRFLLALGADDAQADDLTQETFLHASLGIAGYRGTASPRAWLCGIALRRLIRARERASRDRRALARMAETPEPPPAPRPDEGGALDLLAGLAPEDRALIWLRTVADWPYAEVARALGITPNAARVRHFRLMARLRSKMRPPSAAGGRPGT